MENKELVVRNPDSLLEALSKTGIQVLYCVALHNKEDQVEFNIYTNPDEARKKSQCGELLVSFGLIEKVSDYILNVRKQYEAKSSLSK